VFISKQRDMFESDENSIPFDSAQIKLLHSRVLEESLHTLSDNRNGQKVRDDVMDWVMRDRETAFAFVTCCKLVGVDPEKMRDRIKYLQKKWKKEECDG